MKPLFYILLLILLCIDSIAGSRPATKFSPQALAFLPDGTLLISDLEQHRIFRLGQGGKLIPWAGIGQAGSKGDGLPAHQAQFNAPYDLLVDTQGNVLVADANNHCVRKIDPKGVVTTVVGSKMSGYTGDGGLATAATLNHPQDLALDRAGNLYIADTFNHVIRKVDKQGIITTVAGSEPGLAGDGGPALQAQMSLPLAVAITSKGTLLISDGGNSRIRQVTPDGILSTSVGHGPGSGLGGAGFSGDGGPANQAKIFAAADLLLDANDNFHLSDTGNNRIRLVPEGQIETIPPQTNALQLLTPQKIIAGRDGSIYIADRGQGRVTCIPPLGNPYVVVGPLSANPTKIKATATARLPRPSLIDDHLFGAMKRDRIPHAAPTDDYEFCRRVHLDLTGRIPTRAQLLTFVESKDPKKRDRLIDTLIDSPAWVDHWSYWLGDLVRNCANRIGNPATQSLDRWIRESFASDKPYNQMATELLTASAPDSGWMPDAGPAAFLARWHVPGDTMYSDRHEDTADEIIVQSSRLFLGINYQCISCHGGKGFLEKVNLDLVSKKRSDFWAMGAFFGKTRVRIVPYQDRFSINEDGSGYDTTGSSSVRLKRLGGDITPTFILTGEKADPNQPLRPQFARMLTSHPQFARAAVNLIWEQFFGVGIVDPFDSFDLARQNRSQKIPEPWTVQPTNPKLLEDLGRQFEREGYSLKQLMRRLARSRAYQLSSRFDGEWKESYQPYFARHATRKLTPEQLHDAICQATESFGHYPRRDMVYGTPLPPIRYWTEAPTPEEISNGEAKAFLQPFGQANREQFDRESGGSILQGILMMNHPFVNKKVQSAQGTLTARLLKSTLSAQEVVTEIYLSALSRPPTEEEIHTASDWITSDRKQGIEDLQWAVLNKLDFLLND